MESLRGDLDAQQSIEDTSPSDLEAGRATCPTLSPTLVADAPDPDYVLPGSEKSSMGEQLSSPAQPKPEAHARVASRPTFIHIPATDFDASTPFTTSGQSSGGENDSQDGLGAPTRVDERDNSDSGLKKETFPAQNTPIEGNEPPKKVLYIPVSDNIREVDARRLFNLLSQFDSVKSSSGKSYNYEEKYPEDAPEQELGEDARVFKVYNDLAEEYDRDMVRGFRDTLDSLLIFASLFSAVITTFVVQTAQALPTDQAVVTNHLLVDITTLLRANGNTTVLAAIPPSTFGPDTSTFKTADIWINGLFFASLSLSLATALLSVLAKQWLQAYTAIIPGSAKEIALIRHLRFRGLEKWKMYEIIGALPLILHASLALFFAGLFIFVRTLYEGSIVVPAIDLQCPYRVTLLYRPSKYVGYAAQCLIFILRRAKLSIAQMVFYNYSRESSIKDDRWPDEPGSLQKGELDAVSGDGLTSDCLLWLRDLSSNITVRRIVAWTAAAKTDDNTGAYMLQTLKEKHPDMVKLLFGLPMAKLLCQSAFDADDTTYVVCTSKTDSNGRPTTEFTFPSAVDGRDNDAKLQILVAQKSNRTPT
ncbi:hypothetical protein DL96DRAFT_234353 [Flagelloscypha sp. PMI_526]|nr:hypothetical protein DL96DRAFT_234353 [Flagelloscypha sp. PMI_526]